jgi:hypothetical protein
VTVSIDELGPVDWIVVEFPGTKLTGEIAPIIKDYVDRGLIKVLDLVFLKKDEGGSLEVVAHGINRRGDRREDRRDDRDDDRDDRRDDRDDRRDR